MRSAKFLALAAMAALALMALVGAASAAAPQLTDVGSLVPAPELALGLAGSLYACGAVLRIGNNRQLSLITPCTEGRATGATALPLSTSTLTVTVTPSSRGTAFTQRKFSVSCDDAASERSQRLDHRFPNPLKDRHAPLHPLTA